MGLGIDGQEERDGRLVLLGDLCGFGLVAREMIFERRLHGFELDQKVTCLEQHVVVAVSGEPCNQRLLAGDAFSAFPDVAFGPGELCLSHVV